MHADSASPATSGDASTPAADAKTLGGAELDDHVSASPDMRKSDTEDAARNLDEVDGHRAASPSAAKVQSSNKLAASGDTPDGGKRELPDASAKSDDGKSVPDSAASPLPADASKAVSSTAAKPIAPGTDKPATTEAAGKSPIPKPEVTAASGDPAAHDPALAKPKAAAPDASTGTMSDGTGPANAAAKEKPNLDKPAGPSTTSTTSKLPESANAGTPADSDAAGTSGVEMSPGKSGVPGLENSKDVASDAADAAKLSPSGTDPMEAMDATAENASSLKESLLSKLKDAVG